MREMRDSGVAWIGEIPEEWSLIRFKDKYKNSKEIAGETLYEQQKIADFLDRKCAKIDHLITLKQSKIEKLEQYKRSLIYEYVTGKREVI